MYTICFSFKKHGIVSFLRRIDYNIIMLFLSYMGIII